MVAFCTLPAPAQEPVNFGLGISYNPAFAPGDNSGRFHSDGMADYYLIMQVGQYFRAELQFGFFSPTSDQTDADSLGEFTERVSQSILRSTLGVFYTWSADSSFVLYAGPRVGVLSSVEYRSYSRASPGYFGGRTHWGAFVATASFGAEYHLSHHFALGGELQLTSTGYGVPMEDPALPGYPQNAKEQVYSTGAIVFARFFF
ncbi:MAG TPA: outer membrane beta-barrel protein [Bacteroidota bacterium]|nr:outer membrane beta-barrel protein [Bacteroidota bacterium]